MTNPGHGHISIEVEGYTVTATLTVDPRKIQLTPAQKEEVDRWLKNMLEMSMAQFRRDIDQGIGICPPFDSLPVFKQEGESPRESQD